MKTTIGVVALIGSLVLNGVLLAEKMIPSLRMRRLVQQKVDEALEPSERAHCQIKDIKKEATWYVSSEKTAFGFAGRAFYRGFGRRRNSTLAGGINNRVIRVNNGSQGFEIAFLES